jgi:serine/threonine-protein kinase RIO1/thiol-disulfide isomerase/thioredoxin
VYESGTHDAGTERVPYFAMEYIPNAKTITEYASEKNLGTRARLELFARVCDAVHHGHQKGIIHRDLKPGNILVDPTGEPRIIDFGVARATDSDMAVTTLQTDVGQLVGTIQYMSPEQCDADPQDIDTRSDVYSLGVILYELLCGKRPYEVRGLGVTGAAAAIRDCEPKSPGTIDPRLRGDLETIALTAMAKERDRRYQSAFGLAQDIRRYLRGDAIAARPPSLVYQLRVFARRNKLMLGAVAVVFLVLIGGVITSTSLFLKARANRVEAENQAVRAEATLASLQDLLTLTDPNKIGPAVKVSELLEAYTATIDDAFPGQPAVEANVRTTIGLLYSQLDLFEKGGRDRAYQQEAMKHLTAALEIRNRLGGDDHPDTLVAKENLAGFLAFREGRAESERLIREVLESRRTGRGIDHPEPLGSMYDLAGLLHRQGRRDEAESLSREALEIRRRIQGNDHPDTLESVSQVAVLVQSAGGLDEAESLKREVYDTNLRLHGPDARASRAAAGDLANVLLARGDLAGAEALFGGKEMPTGFGVGEWLHGRGNLATDDPVLLVFWESWCPSSYRALPGIEEVHREYRDQGLQVVGLTRLTRQSTGDKVRDVIEDRHLSWPTASESGRLWDYFKPSGIPGAVVLMNRRVVWQGSPRDMTRDMLDGLIGARH